VAVSRIGKLSVDYDDTTDVLYVSIGEPRPALTKEDEEKDILLLRQDPATGETVGVTIIGYYEHFRNLTDLSWLDSRGLPPEIIDYLQERPKL
jgi:uncharacterized protein YuzE